MMADQPKITRLDLYRLRLPLVTPYRLSYRTFTAFEPIIAIVRDEKNRRGFGEGHISPGSSFERPDNGWSFCCEQAKHSVGKTPSTAIAGIKSMAARSPVAATALISAMEMMQGHELLQVDAAVRLPLLTPFNSLSAPAIASEVEQHLAAGFRTIKIKVGADVQTDLARVSAIQDAVAGRATLRIDANRGYGRAEGCRFAAALDPQGIELFEQPCASDDWEANAAVARVSRVPLMLDEPICALADIERAALIEGVGFCKLKLKRFGSLGAVHTALNRVRELGMEPVLGDGLASEPGCWMEACVARTTIRNAGEFNGFLKPAVRLFSQPLVFADGMLLLQPGIPELNESMLAELTIADAGFSL